MDLVAHAVRVDHHARVMPNHNTCDRDFATGLIDRHIGDPGRPGGTKAGEFAVNIARIGKTTPAQHTIFRRGLHRFGVRRPASALGGAEHQFCGTLILDITQPIFQWIHAGRHGQLINIGFVREGIRQCRHPAHPGGSNDGCHVLNADAQFRVFI
ncbi:hypothetical protein D3C78_1104020 [compost metagenome]